VNEQIAARQQHIHDLRDQLDRALLTPERCAELGERLIDFITSATEVLGHTRPNLNQTAVQVGGNQYALSAATSQEFWHEVLSITGPINLIVAGSWRSVDRATLGRVVGTGLEPDDWQPEARAARSERVREAEKEIGEVRWADLTTIFGMPDLTVTTQHGQISLRQMATRTLESPLAVDLLTSGYIDRNFALYVAQYYDVHLGPSAMNFILHVVERGAQDFEYTFDDARDVPDLIEELGTGFVGTQSAYNIAIFDYLLTEGADLVRLAVASLTRGTENDLRCIDAYLNRGADPELLIGQLSFVWDDTFTYLAATDRFTEPLLSAALNNCAADRSYAKRQGMRRHRDHGSRHCRSEARRGRGASCDRGGTRPDSVSGSTTSLPSGRIFAVTSSNATPIASRSPTSGR
jgi:hypothetical protein